MQQLYTIGQFILLCCNLALMFWMFRNFLRRPQDELKARVAALESRTTANEVAIKENRASLKQGNDRFRKQDAAIEVITQNVLALVEFEIEYCLTEHKTPSAALEEAKKELNKYLSRR